MKVGDLVKWESILKDDMDRHQVYYGVIVNMSRTGRRTHSAEVLFTNGNKDWFDTERLVVVNESG